MTLAELVARMGLIPWLVIGLLAALNVLTLTVAAVKWSRLRALRKSTRAFAPQFALALQEDRVEDAVQLARMNGKSHLARVLGDALERAAPLLDDPELAGRAVESAERMVLRGQIRLATELKHRLSALATIGATAPFVGLLGTVVGITNSFMGIARSGGGGIEAVAGGAGEALITTAVGLVVAIPALWLYNYCL